MQFIFIYLFIYLLSPSLSAIYFYAFQFILDYDFEAPTSIHTNRCKSQYLQEIDVCYTNFGVQGTGL